MSSEEYWQSSDATEVVSWDGNEDERAFSKDREA